jgi:ribosomal protein L19
MNVKDGRVQRKNRQRPTGHNGYVISRENPGPGCRHVVSKRDLQAFIDIIPEWSRYSERLERIVLAESDAGCDGAYLFYRREETGAIILCSLPEDLWAELPISYFIDHQGFFDAVGLAYDFAKETVNCRFTEAQARAFLLVHVFMHELGHHWDRIHQKHSDTTRGEDYAEHFATSRFDQLFPAYVRVFGHPGRGSD